MDHLFRKLWVTKHMEHITVHVDVHIHCNLFYKYLQFTKHFILVLI